MPRRPPPSALLLHTGPTPPRTQPKHYLPSLPQPTFYPVKAASPPVLRPMRSRVMDITIPTPAVISPYYSPPPSPQTRTKSALRGPWDHSRSLSESTFDVDSLIKLPEPAAVTVSPLLSSVW